jgi:golgin subfamily B member 1
MLSPPVSETTADVAGLRRLVTTHERQRNWSGFVEVCLALAAHPDKLPDAVSFLQKAAVATESHLGKPDEAEAIWRQVMERDADNRYAFAALRRLYAARRAWEDLEALSRHRGALRTCLQTFEEELKKAAGDGDRLDLLVRVARLQLESGMQSGRGRALELYEEVRAIDPDHREAAEQLARLYDPDKQTEKLVEVLRVARGSLDPAEVGPLLHRLAGRAEADGDHGKAIECWSQVLELDGDDLQAVAALLRMHAAREDWSAVEGLILSRATDLATALLEGPREREAFVALVAVVADLDDRLAVGAQAFPWYERAIEIAPEDPRLAFGFQRAAEAEEDPRERARLLAQSARLWQKRGEAKRAFDQLLEVVRVLPEDDGAATALEDAAAFEDRWEEVAESYREMAGQPLTMGDQIRIRVRLARVYADEIGDDDRAVKTFQRVIDLSPNGEGIDDLARFFEKRRRWDELYQLLHDKKRPLLDEAGRQELDARLAGLLHDRLANAPKNERKSVAAELASKAETDDGDAAFDALVAVLMSPEADRSLLKSFEKLAERTGRWDDYFATCEDFARRVEEQNPRKAVDLWLQIATAYEVRKDDTTGALHAIERASELSPERQDLLVRRAELHRRREEWLECDLLLARLGAPANG